MSKAYRNAAQRVLVVLCAVAMVLLCFSGVVHADDSDKTPVSMIITQDIKYSSTPIDLTVTVTYSDGSTEVKLADSWRSSAPNIAYVKDNKLYFNGYNGEVTITAFLGNLSASKTANIVRYPTSSMTKVEIEGNLVYSEYPIQLLLRGFYADDTSEIVTGNISWRSSNTKVATVDNTGLVKFTGENGTVTITARFGSLESSKTVTVSNPVPNRISIIGNLDSFSSPTYLNVRAYYSDGTNKIVSHGVKWKTSNSSVATVSDDGVVTFHKSWGNVTVTAEYLGRTASVHASRDGDIVEYIMLEGDFKFSPKRSRQLTVKAMRVDGKTVTIDPKDVIWLSSDESIATIDKDGYITFHGKGGNISITVFYGGKTTTRYAYITVPKLNKIEFINTFPDKKNNKPVQLKIRAVYESPYGEVEVDPASVTWTSSDTHVATVSESGLLEFTEYGGKTQITAEYMGFKVSTTIEREGRTYEQVHRKKIFASNIDTFAVIDNIEKRKNSTTYNQEANFADMSGHWAEKEVHLAKRLGIVPKYAYNRFEPNTDVTRAEFVSYLINALGIEDAKSSSKFKDVRGHWAENAINTANKIGLVGGFTDGTFRPDAKITRAEIAAILSRTIDFSNVSRKYNYSFTDTKFHWAESQIKRLADIGIIRGIKENEFGPNRNATRAETVILILRVLRLDPEIAAMI